MTAKLGPLFDGLPRARTTDPRSSHRTAKRAKRNGTIPRQALETMVALREHGGEPTSKELSGGDADRRYVYARRLPELAAVGLVVRIEQKGHDTRWRLNAEQE